MKDDDDDEEDEGDTTIDFLNFNWEMNNGDDDQYDVDHHDHLIPEMLHRLAMRGMMSGMDDLHSIIQWIGSPLLRRLFEEQESNANLKEQSSNPEVNEFRNVNSSENYICILCRIITLHQRINAVQNYMGTMAQCRGTGGDTLREAGAIRALLNVLWNLSIPKIDSFNARTLIPLMLDSNDDEDDNNCARFDLNCICDHHIYLRKNDDSTPFDDIVTNELHMTAIHLATSCLASLRDLACGSALNRAAVLIWTPPPSYCNETCMIENGVHLLCEYMARYDGYKFEDILSLRDTTNSETAIEYLVASTDRGKSEIRMLTNVLGVVRNASHSTPDICQEMFNHGIVDRLVRLLLTSSSGSRNGESTTAATSSSLPDVLCPWREASFRTAGSLINLAEKCSDVASQLASNRQLINCLLEFWGGTSTAANVIYKLKISSRALPILHLGLAAILNAAAEGALDGGLDEVMRCVLKNETIRRGVAQRKEDLRKLGCINFRLVSSSYQGSYDH